MEKLDVTLPCNIYCRPDENIHVVTSWCEYPAEQVMRHIHQLEPRITTKESCIGPIGTLVKVIRIDPAAEMNEPQPPGCETWHPVLHTLQVIE